MGTIKRERNSNLEILRIISMLIIIAHHYVVCSGIMVNFDLNNLSAHTIFLQIFGSWGKTAINAFILISGYFMCMQSLTWKRYLKVWLEA